MFKVTVDDVKVHVVFSYITVPCKRDSSRREIHCFLHRPGSGTNGRLTTRDWVGYGIAKYNPDDLRQSSDPKFFHLRYNEHKGRKIALNRALTNAGFDKETRDLFWKKFNLSEKDKRKANSGKARAFVEQIVQSL